MKPRTRAVVATVSIFVVLTGFAIGAWLAILARSPHNDGDPVTMANSASPPNPVPTVVQTPTLRATAAPVATPPPAAAATPTAAARPTATPAPPTEPPTARAAVQGAWRIDEANVHVGTIVWSGDAAVSSDRSLVLDVHKQRVGGRAAVPCERQTVLHAVFSLGVAEQTVPYREVNCAGVVSSGVARVSRFSADGRSFGGTFWEDGLELGTFDARKR